MLQWAQSFTLIAANDNILQKMKLNNLKQYLWRWFFLISEVELPPNKTIKTAEKTQQKVGGIIEANLDINKEDFEYESYALLSLSSKSKSSNKKKVSPQPSNIIRKFRIHC